MEVVENAAAVEGIEDRKELLESNWEAIGREGLERHFQQPDEAIVVEGADV